MPKVVAYREPEYHSQYGDNTALQFLVSLSFFVQRRTK